MAESNEIMNLLSDLRARQRGVAKAQSDKAAWMSDLEKLMTLLDGWIEPLTEAGVLEVDKRRLQVHEPDLGTYEVPTRAFSFPGTGAWVSVEPRGVQIPGAVLGPGRVVQGMSGKVDMASATGDRLAIFRTAEGEWRIFGDLPGHGGFDHALSPDTFAAALKLLLP